MSRGPATVIECGSASASRCHAPANGESGRVPSRTKNRGEPCAASAITALAKHAERRFLLAADDQQIAARVAGEGGGRRLLDRHRRAEPGLRSAGRRRRRRHWPARRASCAILGRIGRLVAFEDDRRRRRLRPRSAATVFDLAQVLDPLRLGEPHDLKRMIAGQAGRSGRCKSLRPAGSDSGPPCSARR